MELVIAALLLAAAAFDDAPKAPKSAVCHVPPGNPANARTLMLPDSALADHLGHGDAAGACAADVPAGGKPGAPAGKAGAGNKGDAAGNKADAAGSGGRKSKSPVCHAADGASPRTLYLPPPAVQAHLRHGDAAGACAGEAGPGEGAR